MLQTDVKCDHLAGGESELLTVVGDSSNERLAIDVVAEGSESLVRRGKNGLVTALKSGKKSLAIVTNDVGERREVVGTESTKKTLSEGSSVVALGKSTSARRKGKGENSEELHLGDYNVYQVVARGLNVRGDVVGMEQGKLPVSSSMAKGESKRSRFEGMRWYISSPTEGGGEAVEHLTQPAAKDSFSARD